MDRTQEVQTRILRALLALCRAAGVPDEETPPDVPDYDNKWLTSDLWWVYQADAKAEEEAQKERERNSRRR